MQTFCLCIPTDIEHSYRLLLGLHSIIAVSVYPSLIDSWAYVWQNFNRQQSWMIADQSTGLSFVVKSVDRWNFVIKNYSGILEGFGTA